MKRSSLVHWLNAGFTIGTLTLDADVLLKVGAFLFVTLPLGYVQWVNAIEKWKARRKRNGST